MWQLIQVAQVTVAITAVLHLPAHVAARPFLVAMSCFDCGAVLLFMALITDHVSLLKSVPCTALTGTTRAIHLKRSSVLKTELYMGLPYMAGCRLDWGLPRITSHAI